MKKKKGYGLFGTNKRKPAKKVDKYTEEYFEDYEEEYNLIKIYDKLIYLKDFNYAESTSV